MLYKQGLIIRIIRAVSVITDMLTRSSGSTTSEKLYRYRLRVYMDGDDDMICYDAWKGLY